MSYLTAFKLLAYAGEYLGLFSEFNSSVRTSAISYCYLLELSSVSMRILLNKGSLSEVNAALT